MKNNLLKLSLITVFVITILLALSIMVNAADGNVAKIGEKEYASLETAVKEVPADGTETTITLLRNVEAGSGFKVKANQNIVIDFDNHTYDASLPTVGSTGTETNGCQLLKGSKVTFKNGTLLSTTAAIVIQNYSDLTLLDMTVDSTNSIKDSYALSCNNGEINILGNTSLRSNGYAFDMCWAPNVGYPEGTQITVDTTGKIEGDIQLDVWGDFREDIKSTLNIKNIKHIGRIEADQRLAKQLTIQGGTYTSDVQKYISDESVQIKVSDTEYKVGPKATDLMINENIEITIGETKKLDLTVKPIDTIQSVVYSSNDNDIVTVDENGNVTAVKPGEAVITVKIGDMTKECKVKVNAKEVSVDLPVINEDGESVAVGVLAGTQMTLKDMLVLEAKNNEEVKQALDEGKDVKVEVSVDNIDAEKISEEDKNLISKIITESGVAQYFDINLFIKVNGNQIGKIEEPSKALTFELFIPAELLKENREFYIVRVHNGIAEKIDGTLKDNKFIFETDKFSTYALVYTDEELGETGNTGTNKPNTDIEEEKDDTPKTGVTTHIFFASVVGIVAMAGVVVLRKRK